MMKRRWPCRTPLLLLLLLLPVLLLAGLGTGNAFHVLPRCRPGTCSSRTSPRGHARRGPTLPVARRDHAASHHQRRLPLGLQPPDHDHHDTADEHRPGLWMHDEAIPPDVGVWLPSMAFALVALCLVNTSLLDLSLAHPANAAALVPDAAGLTNAIDFAGIIKKAGSKAIGGGVSGAAASLVQLMTLGWLRTTMNYQYRYGLSLKTALGQLYEEGGIPRFYQGLSVAAIQLPLARFADVAANAFMIAALNSFDSTRDLPLPLKSAVGSITAGAFRILLMPLDAVKTTLQVQGPRGLPQITTRLREEGISSLYQGAVAQSVATAVGHWPYFLTFNYLSTLLPLPPEGAVFPGLGRNAFLGLCSSTASDICSNSFRVIKTTKQTSETQITYQEALRQVLDKDGTKGLFGRGLQTRLFANALQGMLFAVVWRYLEESQILFGGK